MGFVVNNTAKGAIQDRDGTLGEQLIIHPGSSHEIFLIKRSVLIIFELECSTIQKFHSGQIPVLDISPEWFDTRKHFDDSKTLKFQIYNPFISLNTVLVKTIPDPIKLLITIFESVNDKIFYNLLKNKLFDSIKKINND